MAETATSYRVTTGVTELPSVLAPESIFSGAGQHNKKEKY
jgi:hypothetical protein